MSSPSKAATSLSQTKVNLHICSENVPRTKNLLFNNLELNAQPMQLKIQISFNTQTKKIKTHTHWFACSQCRCVLREIERNAFTYHIETCADQINVCTSDEQKQYLKRLWDSAEMSMMYRIKNRDTWQSVHVKQTAGESKWVREEMYCARIEVNRYHRRETYRTYLWSRSVEDPNITAPRTTPS